MSDQVQAESRIGIASSFRFQWEEAQNAYVLLYPEGMVTLNDSAGHILKRCDGTRTFAEVVADLSAEFPNAKLEDDVKQFLEIAHERGWICYQ
jgi:pyrroloquinoline quinone biosynthesis protein D